MPCAPRPASSGGGGGGVLNIPRRASRRVVLRGGRWRVSRACVAHDAPKTKRRFGFAARGAASAPGGRGARPRAPGASNRATRTAEKKVGRAQAQGRAPGRPLSACRVSTLRMLSAAASFIPIGAPRRPPQRREPAFAPLQGAWGANESQREGAGGRRRAAQAGGVVRALAPPAVLGYPSEVPSGGSLACLPSWAIRGASRARCGFGLRPGGRPGRWSRSVQPVNSGWGMARGGAARRGAREALNQKRVWEPRNDLAAVNQPRGAAG